MSQPPSIPSRRTFLTQAAAATATLYAFSPFTAQAQTEKKPERDPELLVIGPRPGYSPMIGTMVSMLTYIQQAVIGPVKNLTQADLDHLFDANANTIGALLLHLAATETYYQMNTFDNMKWDSWSADIKKKWDPAMNLGDAGRKEIKGHDIKWYLNVLKETREKTLTEFKKRDDAWFQSGPTEQFGDNKVNIHWKWFHVCEHESHHSGQMSWLAKRLPGAKPGND
jgi:uncharacterized damage-inducible protein DinB